MFLPLTKQIFCAIIISSLKLGGKTMAEAVFGQLVSLGLALLALYFLLTLIHPALGKHLAKALRRLGSLTWRHAVVRPVRALLRWVWRTIVVPAGRWMWNTLLWPALRWAGRTLLRFFTYLGGVAINGILSLWAALSRRRPRRAPAPRPRPRRP